MSSPEHPARDLPAGTWHPVSAVDVPGEGRVRSVTVDGRSIALTRCGSTSLRTRPGAGRLLH